MGRGLLWPVTYIVRIKCICSSFRGKATLGGPCLALLRQRDNSVSRVSYGIKRWDSVSPFVEAVCQCQHWTASGSSGSSLVWHALLYLGLFLLLRVFVIYFGDGRFRPVGEQAGESDSVVYIRRELRPAFSPVFFPLGGLGSGFL